jgi:copper(I)-binding protein
MRDAEAGRRGRSQHRRWQLHRRWHRGRRWLRPARAVAACLALTALGAGATGCVAKAGAAPSVQLSAAYVAAPRAQGTTVAYVQIRNNGPADRLVSARISVGGTVRFVAAAGPQAVAVHTLAGVRVPADGTLAMQPNTVHMVITGAGPLHGGKDVTLTLVFAHAGAVSVVATVTNSQSGGSSYFLN